MFVFVEFNGGSAKAVVMTLAVLLVLFFLPCFSLCSLIFPSPPALCRYLLPRLRFVSSVQQLSVVCSFSARMSFVFTGYLLPLPRLRVVSSVQQLSVHVYMLFSQPF